GQLDGLYVQPGGVGGPIFIYRTIFGMPGIRIVSAITSMPTSVPLTYAAAVGAQNGPGAAHTHAPTPHASHMLIGRLGSRLRQPNASSSRPLITSLHVISWARSDVCVSSLNQTPLPPDGSTHNAGLRYPKLNGAMTIQQPSMISVQ